VPTKGEHVGPLAQEQVWIRRIWDPGRIQAGSELSLSVRIFHPAGSSIRPAADSILGAVDSTYAGAAMTVAKPSDVIHLATWITDASHD
jgi:hypothetical protein